MDNLDLILDYIDRQEKEVYNLWDKEIAAHRLDELRHLTVYVGFLKDKERLNELQKQHTKRMRYTM